MLENLIIIVHALAAIAVVALILLQHGKGADMGASFGAGASQTVLGVQGGGNLLTHATAILTTVFFITSLSLGYIARQKTAVDAEDVIIEDVIAEQTVNDEIPVAAADAGDVQSAEVPAPEAANAAAVAPAATIGENSPAVAPAQDDVPAAEAAPVESAPATEEIPQ